MDSPAFTALPEQPVRKSRRRGCLLTLLIGAMLLVPGFYWFENWSGRRALEKVLAEYEAAGLSLEPSTFLPDSGPPQENFGATPLLDGIMHLEDGSPAAAAASARREGFKKLLPGITMLPVSSEAGSAVPEMLPDVTGNAPEWGKVRAYLDAHTPCKPPQDEPSDARAVFLALDIHRAVLDELIAAAARPRAVFTPSPRERFSIIREGAQPSFNISSTVPLMRLLSLRAHSAAASGQLTEILPLARVLWKMRAAAMNESSAIGHLQGATAERMWVAVAKAMLRSPGVTEAQLSEMAATIPEDWSSERELVNSWRGETALTVEWLSALKNEGVEQYETAAQQRMIRYGPSGWIDQNIVTLSKRRLGYFFMPLRSEGFSALPSSVAASLMASDSWLEEWSPYWYFLNSESEATFYQSIVFKHMRTRLMQLAIGMERYRMQHGCYPVEAAALVPGSIARLPPDIDGAPLRIAVAPDGKSAAVYSIGWNLTDDWRGDMTRYNHKDEQRSLDWPLALPFFQFPAP